MSQAPDHTPQARPGAYPMSVRTRISIADYERLREAAEIAGMSVGAYARHRLSGAHVSSKLDVQILNELRRQGGLAKALAHQGVDTSEALAEIVKTMKAVRAAI